MAKCRILKRFGENFVKNVGRGWGEEFKLGFIGLLGVNAFSVWQTPPPASREPPRRGSLLLTPAENPCPKSDFSPRPKAPSGRELPPAGG